MNFNNMHAAAKQIDTQVKLLEAKVAHPMSMMYSNNSSQGVKILSMLKGMIEDVQSKKKEIEQIIQEENLTWAEMVEDYNTVAKFKSDIIANLNEYENMWSSHYPDYKPFISCGRSDSADENLEDFLDLNVQDNRKIADQSLNNTSLNITMS